MPVAGRRSSREPGPAAAFRAVPAVGLGGRRGEERRGQRERGNEGLAFIASPPKRPLAQSKPRSSRLALSRQSLAGARGRGRRRACTPGVVAGGRGERESGDEGLSLHRESSEASAGSGASAVPVASPFSRQSLAGARRARASPSGHSRCRRRRTPAAVARERPGLTPPRRGRSPRRPRSRPGSARSRARAGPRRAWGSAGSRRHRPCSPMGQSSPSARTMPRGRFTETFARLFPFSTIRTRNHVGAALRAGGAASARGGSGSSAGGRAWATGEEPTAFFTSWRSSSARSAAAGAASAAATRIPANRLVFMAPPTRSRPGCARRRPPRS